jgi:type I restriction enzyme, R subunit
MPRITAPSRLPGSDDHHESETLQQTAQNNTLAQFLASPDLHQQFTDAVLGSMESSHDLSSQILNKPDIFQKLLSELVPVICDEMKKTA